MMIRKKQSFFNRFLNFVEKSGNKLPDPSMLFFIMCVALATITWIVSLFNVAVEHPGTHKMVHVKSIFSRDGLAMILNDAIKNFAEFPALGLVLAVMIGIGVAERTGYFDKFMILVVNKAPTKVIIPTIIFMGIMGNAAGDAAPIILPPLAALVFIKLGYHPIAGLTMAYASALGGFAANLLIGMNDALVYAFTRPATNIIDKDMPLNVAMNWYFVAASVAMLVPVIYFVTTKIVIPRLGTYDKSKLKADKDETSSTVSPQERKALRIANLSFLAFIVLVALLAIPESSFLRNAKTGSILNDSPLINGVGIIILLAFLLPGLIYGIMTKSIRNSKDLGKMLGESMSTMGTFIVIVFFAAQLLAFLEWSNLGVIIAVKGAALLQNQSGIVLILGIIFLGGLINMIIGSASAKWGILAPIFVPMLLILGYHPAFTQMMYRVGDSITNPITPMMPYLPLLLSYAKEYDPKMKLGSLIASLMPYTLFLAIFWPLFMIVWYLLGIPMGPGGPIHAK